MTTATLDQIELNAKGVAYIAGLPFRVTDIARMKQQENMTPEQIQSAVPMLSLAQIYAALAYYYTHQDEIDDAEAHRQQEVETILSRLGPRHQPPTGQNWLSLVAGKWPGDETDEEISAALERMS
jgi:uncharacterized protein (DUF433 family)